MVEVERGEGSLLGAAGFAAASHTIVESAGGALAGAAAGVGGSGGALATQRRRHAMLPYSDSFRVRDEWGEQLSEHEWAAIARGGGVRTATEIAGLGSTFQPAMPLAAAGLAVRLATVAAGAARSRSGSAARLPRWPRRCMWTQVKFLLHTVSVILNSKFNLNFNSYTITNTSSSTSIKYKYANAISIKYYILLKRLFRHDNPYSSSAWCCRLSIGYAS